MRVVLLNICYIIIIKMKVISVYIIFNFFIYYFSVNSIKRRDHTLMSRSKSFYSELVRTWVFLFS